MSKLLYDYTQEFLTKASPNELIDREIIIRYEKGGDLNTGTIARIIERKDNGRYLLIPTMGRAKGGRYTAVAAEMEFVPATRAEFGLAVEGLETERKELEGRIECMEELGIDQLKKSSFAAWKILKACKENKDEEELKKVIVDGVSAIYEEIEK